jgi:hypothetical protein
VTLRTQPPPSARRAALTTALSTVERSAGSDASSHAPALRTRPELPWKEAPLYPTCRARRCVTPSALLVDAAAGSQAVLRCRKSWLRVGNGAPQWVHAVGGIEAAVRPSM